MENADSILPETDAYLQTGDVSHQLNVIKRLN